MSGPRVMDLAKSFFDDSLDYAVKALEEAYWRGHAAREIAPNEQELEALLSVLHYARDIHAESATDWEARHLEAAVDRYDVAACKTPTGKRAHGSFLERVAGKTRCSFCKVSVDQ